MGEIEKKNEQRPDAAKGLTDRQWRFIQEFFVDLNATKAIRRAGYDGTRARQVGSETLNAPSVARAIMELAPTYIGMSRAMVLQGIGRIAQAGDGDHAKLAALDRLARIGGLYKEGPTAATQVHIHIYPEESGI